MQQQNSHPETWSLRSCEGVDAKADGCSIAVKRYTLPQRVEVDRKLIDTVTQKTLVGVHMQKVDKARALFFSGARNEK